MKEKETKHVHIDISNTLIKRICKIHNDGNVINVNKCNREIHLEVKPPNYNPNRTGNS
jgi:hypothetical protein